MVLDWEKETGGDMRGMTEVRRRGRLKTWAMRSKLFTFIFLVGALWIGRCAGQCSSNSSLVGFTADFAMVQHQLRGSFRILDDCTFKVSS